MAEPQLHPSPSAMNPLDIKFSQSSISPFFKRTLLKKDDGKSFSDVLKGPVPAQTLKELLQRLIDGSAKVDDIPPISVVRYDEKWFSLDNRRLWVFRKYAMARSGEVITVPVEVQTSTDKRKELLRKLDGKFDGESVTFHSEESVQQFRESRSLVSEVLGWSLSDIENDGLLANQVFNVPVTFPSRKRYLSCFELLLIEEVRAVLKKELEKLADAPRAFVRDLRERPTKDTSSPLKKFTFTVEEIRRYIDTEADRPGKTKSSFKPMDIVLVTTILPTHISDLRAPGQHYTLALLKHDDDENSNRDGDLFFKAHVSAPTHSPEYAALSDASVRWYLVYLNSLATPTRIWEALHNPHSSQEHNSILSELLDIYKGPSLESPEYRSRVLHLKDQYSQQRFNMNDSQTDALSAVVSGLEMMQPPFVKLVQGPPGTGKTSTLVAMLSLLSTSNRRILVCAPTNTAVCEVVTRFLKVVKDGSQAAFSGGKQAGLSDLVLLGNQERLGQRDDVSEVFLPRRAERLADASCWSQHVLSLIDFLTNAVHIFEREAADGSKAGFLQFARARVRLLGEKMMDDVEVLCRDLPRRFLASTDILAAGSILLEILKLMTANTPDEVARGWFEACQVDETFGRGTVQGELQALLSLLRANKNFVILPDRQVLSSKAVCMSALLKEASVAFCTVSTAGSFLVKQTSAFDLAIVDEASQLVEAESTIVFGMRGLKQVVLVGDHHQLPATVVSQVAKRCGYGRSAFQRLQELRHPSIMLNVQYRMHPSISQFSSYHFYDGKLKDGPNVVVDHYGSTSCLSSFGRYKFINISEGREMNNEEHSKTNPLEAEVLLHLYKKITSNCGREVDVGIISPYAGQVQAIQDRLSEMNLNQPEVNSVDGYQGREKDVILLSTVRSIKLGFLNDYRRLNVAITRARHCVYILGNVRALCSEESFWKTLVIDARSRGCFMEGADDPAIRDLIVKFKKKENMLLDLATPSSTIFNNTVWKVHFSTEFMLSFTKLPNDTKMHIFYSILKLANGFRMKYKRQFALPLEIAEDVEIYAISKLHIVWTVGIHPDNEYQVIKIWDVVRYAQLLTTAKRLSNIFSTYTPEYLKRCRDKRVESGKAVPAVWDGCSELKWYRSVGKNIGQQPAAETTSSEDSEVACSLSFVKSYYLSSEAARKLLASSEASGCDLPFLVTKEESDAIQYPHSSFIIGRSGTGKTTVITGKLLEREKLSSLSVHGNLAEKGEIRQMLVTVSFKLCVAIRDHIGKMQSFTENREPGKLEMDDEAEDHLPNTFMNLPGNAFPVVITFRKFLAMLDGSIKTPFMDYIRRPQSEGGSDCDLQDDLPMPVEVDFTRFASEYWPYMNSLLTKRLEASQVFAEFMSCIKGSADSLRSDLGRLSKEEYMNMACKRVSYFDERQRNMIYSLYLQYEQKKRQTGDYDLGDYVCHLYKRLECGEFTGTKMDFIYVDEVQDLTLGQILLLKFLTNNVDDGFVFAGDTAQTIAKGVNFRFEDIRSLFFTDFLVSTSSKNPKATPKLCQLSQNFRTHDGVVKLAGTVMNLLLHFFPDNVDKLAPETSIVSGEKPVILETEEKNMIGMLFDIDAGGTKCEFGAQQVILVRDNDSKQNLLKLLGKSSLVLTIEECKGLEFQDVLLYNFFSNSGFSSNKWRVIFEYLAGSPIRKLDIPAFPAFERNIHSLLCSELKHLYVALTRAKQRLWIFDETLECQKPMRDCWHAFELIELKQLNQMLISSMYTISTSEEWRQRGLEMFREKQYSSAMQCFQRANEPSLATWAEAADMQNRAEGMVVANSARKQHQKQLFRGAAEKYVSVGKFEAAAKCLKLCDNHQKAGELYRDRCEPLKPEEAADCFRLAKSYNEAAECYARANNLRKCLKACEQGNLFETGLHFIEQWKKENSETEELNLEMETFLTKAARKYRHREADFMKFVDALPSLKAKRNFLVVESLFKQLIDVEIRAGNLEKASDVAEAMGDVETSVNLLADAGNFKEAADKIFTDVQFQALWGNGNTGWPLRPENCALLDKAQALARDDTKGLHRLKVITTTSSSSIPEVLTNWQIARGDCKIELIALRQLLDSTFTQLQASSTAGNKLDLQLVEHCLESQQLDDNVNLLHLAVWTWNSWFEKMASLLQALRSVQKMLPSGDFVVDSCLEYLGISRNPDYAGLFIVEDVAAFWLRREMLTALANRGKRGQLRMQRLVLRATEFWQGHLDSTASEIIDLLVKHARTVGGAEHVKILLKVLDIHDQLLSLSSSEMLQAMSRSYRKEIYAILFMKKSVSITAATDICFLRDEPKVTAQLDKFATEIAASNSSLSTEEVGVLQVLLPFLSREWMTSRLKELFVTDEVQQNRDLSEWLKFFTKEKEYSCSSYVYLTTCSVESLSSLYSLDWRVKEDYINPATFFYLLERSLVTSLTCFRHVTDVILPRSLVLQFMTGKLQELVYTMMLRANCVSQNCQALLESLRKIATICWTLLSRGNELEEWLKRGQISDELPNTIFRLLRTLLIIFMHHDHPREFKSQIFRNINFLFRERSPLLDELPENFRLELQRAFGSNSLKDYELRQTFKDLMASSSVCDPFLVLKREQKQRIQTKGMQEVPVDKINWVFSVAGHFRKETAAATPVAPAAVFSQEDEGNTEEAIIENASLTYESPQLHELPPEQAGGKDDLPPSFVKRKFLWFASWKLMKLLKDIREQDEYIREAKRHFGPVVGVHCAYVVTFIAEVCPLTASYHAFMANLNTAKDVLNENRSSMNQKLRDELLDKIKDYLMEAAPLAELLDPRHEGHRKQDEAWLRTTVVAPVARKLQQGSQLNLENGSSVAALVKMLLDDEYAQLQHETPGTAKVETKQQRPKEKFKQQKKQKISKGKWKRRK